MSFGGVVLLEDNTMPPVFLCIYQNAILCGRYVLLLTVLFLI